MPVFSGEAEGVDLGGRVIRKDIRQVEEGKPYSKKLSIDSDAADMAIRQHEMTADFIIKFSTHLIH